MFKLIIYTTVLVVLRISIRRFSLAFGYVPITTYLTPTTHGMNNIPHSEFKAVLNIQDWHVRSHALQPFNSITFSFKGTWQFRFLNIFTFIGGHRSNGLWGTVLLYSAQAYKQANTYYIVIKQVLKQRRLASFKLYTAVNLSISTF